ncbi:tryptophan synthase subunit alpha [Neobacillus sp. SM06]|uniref:tryptophan synthase subunit alpha n=1 Tax=Neobacillus sp. SM06 TaxID=3422492 RepID=UPI003D2BCFED
MVNKLTETFAQLKRNQQKAFVPYIMAGDGGLDCLIDRLVLLQKMGATAIEVGIPFSDPVADGPTIQSAGIRALKAGTSLRNTLNELEKGKDLVTVPIIVMTYMNPVYRYGASSFVQDLQKAGVAACIIPDLPIEEEDLIVSELTEANIELIRLVTMTTPKERIAQIANRGNGFLYTVTVKGITGVRNSYDEELIQFLKMVKEVSPLPVLAGFGISSENQIIELTNYCDGVIVGSKIVELFAKNDFETMEKLLSVLQSVPR